MQKTLTKLLTLPEPLWDWALGKDTDLLALSFTPDDAADLIAIANAEHIPDDPNHEPTDADWNAATHAYRALAELRDPAHLDVFLDLIRLPEVDDNDFLNEDVIEILPLYGNATVEPCLTALEDQTTGEIARFVHVDVLEELASKGHGKAKIIQRFSAYLDAKHFTRSLNAQIISALITLKADSEIDSIRACHHAHLADITVNGDLEEVELELGLRETRSTDTHPGWAELEQKSLHQALKTDLGPRPDDEVELFCYLFDLYSRDCSANGLSGLHATLTGALLAPRFVKPSEYLPYIWDMENTGHPYSPNWENMEDAQFFMKFIMVMHNQIVESLDKGTFEPIPDERDDNPLNLSYVLWLLTLNRSLGHWNPVSSPRELSENFHQIISHTTAVIQAETLAMEQDTLPDTQQEIRQLSRTLSHLYRENKTSQPFSPLSRGGHYTEQHTREQPKISRNAPCPCGSGKKYKRCCMN